MWAGRHEIFGIYDTDEDKTRNKTKNTRYPVDEIVDGWVTRRNAFLFYEYYYYFFFLEFNTVHGHCGPGFGSNCNVTQTR